MRVALATLGCKVNHYETEAMRELFAAAGWEIAPFPEQADAYVINTCTVTGVSDQKSRQLIARAHRANPAALIAVAGCYAEVSGNEVQQLPGVGLVVGTEERTEIVERVTAALRERGGVGPQVPPSSFDTFPSEKEQSNVQIQPIGPQASPFSFGSFLSEKKRTGFENLSAVRDGRTRATLKIQDGCVSFCSYCIIPYARGPLRSRPLEDVERQLRLLAEEGYLEVVLTGIQLASYGKDFGDGGATLLDVLALTKDIPGIRRVRLGSLEPGFADERAVAAIAENGKVCRQFHLSLQSGSGTVLRRMNRRYTPAEYAAAAARLKNAMPDCALTTDVIAGFCGETEEEHRASMAFCEEMEFARMHVFPFSLRKGTRAAAMPGQLTKAVKEARARELISLGKRLTDRFLAAQVGTVQEVLVEQAGRGYTGNYVHVQTEGRPGEIRRVRITGVENEIATGKELTSE